ncbi:MAG: hypothetical protein ACE14M_05125 [Terriglobales bacterium]
MSPPGTATASENFNSFAWDNEASYWHSGAATYALWEMAASVTPDSGSPVNIRENLYPIFLDGDTSSTADFAIGGTGVNSARGNPVTTAYWVLKAYPVSDGHTATLQHTTLSADRTYTFPDGDGTLATIEWVQAQGYGAGSGGGVTSVGMTGDGTVFSTVVSGSPITSSGTLAPSLKAQTAKYVLAGPASGASTAPTFRQLSTADLSDGVTGSGAIVLADAPTLSSAGITYTGSDATVLLIDAGGSSVDGEPVFKVQLPASGAQKGFQLMNSGSAAGWASFEFNVGGTAMPGLALGPGSAARDTKIFREDVGVIAIGNGSDNSGLLRIYETDNGTDASYLELGYSSGDSRYVVQSQNVNSGTLRDLYLSGATLKLASNNSTRWIVDADGNLVSNGDGNFNIGADGANRPIRIYASSGVTAPDVNTAAATPATSGTMTVNMGTATVFTITPSGDCTFNASGGTAGQRATFFITTSGASSRTLTWGTNFKTTGTLATGTSSGKVFTVSFVCKDGTTWAETSRTTAM